MSVDFVRRKWTLMLLVVVRNGANRTSPRFSFSHFYDLLHFHSRERLSAHRCAGWCTSRRHHVLLYSFPSRPYRTLAFRLPDTVFPKLFGILSVTSLIFFRFLSIYLYILMQLTLEYAIGQESMQEELPDGVYASFSPKLPTMGRVFTFSEVRVLQKARL